MLGALAHDVGAALQVHPGGPADEQLAEGRHGVAGERAQRRVVCGDRSPAEHGQALGFDDLLDRFTGRPGVTRRLRQEGDTGGVAALGRQLDVALFPAHRPQEPVGHLQHDAGSVAAVRFGAGGPAVLQVQQGGDGVIDDVAAAPAVHVDDHGDTTGVVLKGGVVQPCALGHH